ncbi:MAG: hypothetical protein B6226_02810 [Candidatus Cloacimonetes bacterium 4572_65]|nr:MAG: hypothetical protein B6226_02810 [Candidatus Cloacimonetes bacterium 4572_65]
MKYSWIVILILLSLSSLFCKTEVSYLEEANAFFEKGYYRDAESILDQAIIETPNDLEAYLLMFKVKFALQNLLEAYENLNFYLTNNLGSDNDYYNDLMLVLEEGIILQGKGNRYFQLGKMPSYINSVNSDYSPIVSLDGERLFFTSARKSEQLKENVFVANRVNGKWGRPTMVKQLSSVGNESVNSFSKDGEFIYLFGNFAGDRNKQGDIYKAQKVSSAWTTPEKIEAISSKHAEMQPYVFDDKVMFFTSNRPGGLGGYDIWVSQFSGSWEKPINLGSVINTHGDEQTPFLDWDGETLYFSSNGYPTFGGLDIFKSTKVGLSWTDWSEPVNLGVEINTVRNDRHFYKVKNSNEVYLSSDRNNSTGFEDIYKAYSSSEYNSAAVVVSGTVKDIFGNPVSGEITWKCFYDEREFTVKVSSSNSGFYKVYIPQNSAVEYSTFMEGYFYAEDKLDIPAESREFTHNITLYPIEEKSYVINNIFFDYDKAILRTESFKKLDELVQLMTINDSLQASIVGYTDNKGTDSYNQKLSEERAQSVYDYLTSKGISDNLVSFRGEGEKNPRYENDTEENRQKNRRVEFDILKTFKKLSNSDEEELVVEEIEDTTSTNYNELDKMIDYDKDKINIIVIQESKETEYLISFFEPLEEVVINNKMRRLATQSNIKGDVAVKLRNKNGVVSVEDIKLPEDKDAPYFEKAVNNLFNQWKVERRDIGRYIITFEF